MSLRENIAFNAKVTEEALAKSHCNAAELKDFVAGLSPQQLDTVVSGTRYQPFRAGKSSA